MKKVNMLIIMSTFFLSFVIFNINLISSSDNETMFICGGDNETSFLCAFGDNETVLNTQIDAVSPLGGGGSAPSLTTEAIKEFISKNKPLCWTGFLLAILFILLILFFIWRKRNKK